MNITDPFCLELQSALTGLDKTLAGLASDYDKEEIKKLYAGMILMIHFATLKDGESLPREQINYVLRTSLGNGYSWYACLAFLTGKRGQEIFTKRADVFRAIGGTEFMRLANQVLPDMQKNFHLMTASGARG